MPIVTIPDVHVQTAVERCCTCGVVFGMPADLQANRRRDQQLFYCPVGHAQSYSESEAYRLGVKLKEKEAELARVNDNLKHARARSDELLDRTQHQERRINGYKGAVARTKRRIQKGTCPCCSAKFKDLEHHMKLEHPKWNPDAGAEALAGKSV